MNIVVIGYSGITVGLISLIANKLFSVPEINNKSEDSLSDIIKNKLDDTIIDYDDICKYTDNDNQMNYLHSISNIISSYIVFMISYMIAFIYNTRPG